jgi:hypothetical protein
VTPVEMIRASYSSSCIGPSSRPTATVLADRSTPVSVPWTVRTRSRPLNLSNEIQLCLAQWSGLLIRHPSSWPLTNAGLAEIPTTCMSVARLASRIAVSTPLSPRPAMTTRLRFMPARSVEAMWSYS